MAMKGPSLSIFALTAIGLLATGATASVSPERYQRLLQSVRIACAGEGARCATAFSAALEEIAPDGDVSRLGHAQLGTVISTVASSAARLPPSARADVAAEIETAASKLSDRRARSVARRVARAVIVGRVLRSIIAARRGSPN